MTGGRVSLKELWSSQHTKFLEVAEAGHGCGVPALRSSSGGRGREDRGSRAHRTNTKRRQGQTLVSPQVCTPQAGPDGHPQSLISVLTAQA